MDESFDPLKLENQLCFPLYAASKALIRRYEPLLSPLGLTYTQYVVMLVMWEKGEATVNELGEAVYLDSGTLSPLLAKLVSKGYLAKTKTKDGRFRVLSVTEEGKALKEKVKDIPFQIGSCLHLSQDEAMALYNLCYKTLREVA